MKKGTRGSPRSEPDRAYKTFCLRMKCEPGGLNLRQNAISIRSRENTFFSNEKSISPGWRQSFARGTSVSKR